MAGDGFSAAKEAFHGIYTTGGGLGTKMGIYVKESDYEQARPVAERIIQRVGET